MAGGCGIGAGPSRSDKRAKSEDEYQAAMVSQGFLANPVIRRWLNGVEPAWTMLEFDSFNALHDEPAANNHAITTFGWTSVGAQSVTIQNASSSSATVSLPACGLATVAVTVTDDAGRTDTAQVVLGPSAASSRTRWTEADRDRQPVPCRGRGDVRDYPST